MPQNPMQTRDSFLSNVSGRKWLGEGYLLFGKYAGERLADVASEDPGYLQWVLRQVFDIDQGDRKTIRDTLTVSD